jgi:arylsulfatase A
VAKDTLVIFTSDNGGVKEPQRTDSPQTLALNAGLAVNGSLRGGKHHVWEGGFKVPFVVRWPGKAPAGTVCDEMVSLVDILATTAAIVGEKLPPADKTAEDSYNILPAILGESYAKPLRPDMIVHSSDGVFAIRKGPWKWIEGVPVDEIKPAVRKSRAEEFHPQLYNLKEDPAETKDVSAAHPDVVKELEPLLERYRAGGYSRALPPMPAKPKIAATELAPLAGQVVLNDAFAKVPGAPWVQVRGKWTAKDDAVWASQKPGDQQPAALRGPLSLTDATIQYELVLPAATSHGLRLQCQGGQVFRVEISPRNLSIIRQAAAGQSEVVARQSIKLQPGKWYPVRVTMRGTEIKAQVAGVASAESKAFLAETKTAFAFMATGDAIGFRKVTVAK